MMSSRALGWWFVTGQFLLLILLVLLPNDAGFGALDFGFAALGYLALIAGTSVLIVAARNLGRSLTAHPSPKVAGQLVTDGMYARVRHPIYSGLLLIALGITLQNGPFPQLLVFAALWWLLNSKAGFEEQQLLAQYPGYAEYAARTPRFVPVLKRRR